MNKQEMNSEAMKNRMIERNKSFDEMIKPYELELIRRKARVEYFRALYDVKRVELKKDIKGYIFLYEAGPLDCWENGWRNVFCAPAIFYEHEKLYGLDYREKSAYERLVELERLTIEGLTSFSNHLANDFRGEPLKFLDVEIDDYDSQSSLIVCHKNDNNGTCYAWGYTPYLSEDIPHDLGDKWELVDAKALYHDPMND